MTSTIQFCHNAWIATLYLHIPARFPAPLHWNEPCIGGKITAARRAVSTAGRCVKQWTQSSTHCSSQYGRDTPRLGKSDEKWRTSLVGLCLGGHPLQQEFQISVILCLMYCSVLYVGVFLLARQVALSHRCPCIHNIVPSRSTVLKITVFR